MLQDIQADASFVCGKGAVLGCTVHYSAYTYGVKCVWIVSVVKVNVYRNGKMEILHIIFSFSEFWKLCVKCLLSLPTSKKIKVGGKALF